MSKFAKNLDALLASNGMTKEGLAREFGISHTTVSRWKNGATPRPALLKRIAERFGVSVSDLAGVNCEKIGQQLETWRKTQRLSQAEAAKNLGITREYLGKIERGQVDPGNALSKQISLLIHAENVSATAIKIERQTVHFITPTGEFEVSGNNLTVRLGVRAMTRPMSPMPVGKAYRGLAMRLGSSLHASSPEAVELIDSLCCKQQALDVSEPTARFDIRKAAEESGLSMNGLAREMGIAPQTLSRGLVHHQIPYPPTLKKIADFFGVSVATVKSAFIAENKPEEDAK